jgi:MFS family permease
VTAALSPRQRLAAIATGSAGNLIEWFDFYVYAFAALYFAASFFPEGDRTAQLLNVAGIYAVGFLIRPVGGWFFGRFADRQGRRAALIAAVLLMGFGSLMIAVLPTHASIGGWAPALLLAARLLQGFSTGGQFGAAATYLSEMASDAHRGFYASFLYVTLIAGQLCALLVLVVLQQVLDEPSLRAWGWRIPFAIGAVMAISVLLLRDHLHESADPTRRTDAGSLRALARHPRALFVVVALTAGGGLCLYTFTTYMQKFLVNTTGLDIEVASNVMLASMLGFMLLQPAMGALSDRLGRRACLIAFAGVMTVSAVPLLRALSVASSAATAFVLVFVALAILSLYTSISGLFKAELFPPHVRALGVGLAHSVSIALFGGTAEYVALSFKSAGHESYFFWYVSGICGVAFVTAVFMREPRRASMSSSL